MLFPHLWPCYCLQEDAMRFQLRAPWHKWHESTVHTCPKSALMQRGGEALTTCTVAPPAPCHRQVMTQCQQEVNLPLAEAMGILVHGGDFHCLVEAPAAPHGPAQITTGKIAGTSRVALLQVVRHSPGKRDDHSLLPGRSRWLPDCCWMQHFGFWSHFGYCCTFSGQAVLDGAAGLHTECREVHCVP